MRQPDRDKLLAALLDGEPESPILKELTKFCSEDITRIEPVIDDLIRQAETRGRLQTWLEVADNIYNSPVDTEKLPE